MPNPYLQSTLETLEHTSRRDLKNQLDAKKKDQNALGRQVDFYTRYTSRLDVIFFPF